MLTKNGFLCIGLRTLIHKKKVEVIAPEWRQNFMLALGNLIITPENNQNFVL